jgi:lysophospholipase L1-like esterase
MKILITTILGRAIISVSFILMLFISACSKDRPAQNAVYLPMDTSAKPKSYLALGDSYTIGQSVSIDQRLPVQAVGLLASQGIQMTQADIIATTGWTTANLLNSLNSNSPAKTYDFVTLLIGVNNQYQGRSTDEYRLQFTELLNKAIGYAAGNKKRVFVLSIPDYSVTPFAQYSDTARIAREIDIFNAINKEITLLFGVAYVEITSISRQARSDPALTATDGLHPSGKQYERWAQLLAPLMKAAL